MFNLSSSDLILFLLVFYVLTAAPLTIILPIIAQRRNKNLSNVVNFLFSYLAIPFFLLIISFLIIGQYPTFFQNIIAFLNKINFTNANYSTTFIFYLIMLIIFIFISVFAHFQNQVFNDNASLFLKYKTYCFRVSAIILAFGFYLAFYRIFLGNVVFEIAKIVIYIGVFLCSIIMFIEIHYKLNIYYVLEKLIRNLNQLDSCQRDKRLIIEFTTDFRTFLNLLDKRLPKNIKINDFDLKIKENKDIKYIINTYLKTYITFGTKEQLASLGKNVKEIKNILLEKEPKNIISARTKIINIFNDIEKFLQENKIKQHNDGTGTFLNHIKNGKYSEIKNQSFAFLTLVLLYLLIMIIQMAIAGELEPIFEHFNF